MNRFSSTQVAAIGMTSLALFALLTLAGAASAAEGTATIASAAVKVDAARPGTAKVTTTVDRDEQRIKDLHDRLQITPTQEALWSKVADVMRSNDRTMDALAKTRRDAAATRTAAEDLRSYGEITEAHAVGIKTFAAAFQGLYDSMSKAQKSNADEVFRNQVKKSPRKGV